MKNIIEVVAQRDLITGQKLTAMDYALMIAPSAIVRHTSSGVRKIIDHLPGSKCADDIAEAAESAAKHADDVDVAKHADDMKGAFGSAEGVKGGSKPDVLAQNRAKGRAFEQQQFAKFSRQNKNAVEKITIETSAGTKTRVDAIGLDSKSSMTAPLTKNQAKAFPEIFASGGTVVGKGKGIFTNGYLIPKGINYRNN